MPRTGSCEWRRHETQEGLRAAPGGRGSDLSRRPSRLVRVVAGSRGTRPGSGSVLKVEHLHC